MKSCKAGAGNLRGGVACWDREVVVIVTVAQSIEVVGGNFSIAPVELPNATSAQVAVGG